MVEKNKEMIDLQIELELEELENIKNMFGTIENGKTVKIGNEEAVIKIVTTENEMSFGGGVIVECLLSFHIGIATSVLGNAIYNLCKGGKKLLLNNKRTRISQESINEVISTIIATETKTVFSDSNKNSKNKLFISHAYKDKDYIEIIVSLLENLGLEEDEIICSSIPPYCIPLDKKVYDWLVNEFQKSKLHMLFVLSHNYYKSEACLNEMGAAWALKHNWTGILLPKFGFSDIKGCIDPTQISIKLDDNDIYNLNYRLSELKDNLTIEFGLKPLSQAVWERKRDDFINRILEVTNKRLEENSKSKTDTDENN